MGTESLCGHNSRLDAVGGVLSVICALHCLALPIALPFLAAAVGNVWFEGAIMLGALVLGGLALSHGFRWHGFRWPIWSFGSGMVSLAIGNWVLTGGQPLCCAFRDGHEHAIPPISFSLVALGGVLILAAHITNFALERKAKRHGIRKSA
jgi:hypothetical protein